MSSVYVDIHKAAQLYKDGCSLSEIGRMFGCSYMTIRRRFKTYGVDIRKRKLVKTRKTQVSIDEIVHEYLDLSMTSYELAEKYDVNSATIRKWMREAGVKIGKENAPSRQKHHGGGGGGGAEILKSRCRERIERKLANEGNRLELVGYREKLLLRCTVCGYEFEKAKGGYNHRFTCPECFAREVDERRRTKKYERQQQFEAAREWLLSTSRVCDECGGVFFSEYEGSRYCCSSCRNTARQRRQAESRKARGVNRGTYRRRMRVVVTADTYDRSVTLSSVYKKFGGRCCSCGRQTFRTKEYSPSQATLDHIIALANNGTHTWDNVQLLCAECNSSKRDLGQMRLAI